MTDIVVSIGRMLGQSFIKLESGPDIFMQNAEPKPFALTLDHLSSWPQPTPVRAYGKALLNTLLAGESVQDAIHHVIKGGGALHFLLEDTELHKHSWEALWHETFLALDANWAISRLVKPQSDPKYDARLMEFPLRILAVLGAAGISAVDEWEKLLEVATGAAQNGLEIKINVLAAEKPIVESIDNLGALQNLTVKASPMPGSKQALISAINSFEPHILHFFCHGESKTSVPLLLITDANHFRSTPPIKLDIESLTAKTRIKDGWIVVINACRAGESSSVVYSLTHQLVERGVPAAVGMMEEIDAAYAKIFCQSFYRAAFNEISRVQKVLGGKPVGESEEIHWTEVLRDPRSSLSDEYKPADEKREWTLPVLYIRRHGFQVRLPAKDSQSFGTTSTDENVIKGLLAVLGDEHREKLLATLSNINGS